METRTNPGDTLTFESIEARLKSLAASAFVDAGIDELEMRHLLDILTRSSLLLREAYDPDTLDRIFWNEGRPAALLGPGLGGAPRLGEGRLLRLMHVPDVLRNCGDKCLYDVGLAGRKTIRGVALADLGPRAYSLAGQALALLADDRALREFYDRNLLERLPIDEEVLFLRQCATRFRLYAEILQAFRTPDRDRGPSVPPVRRDPASIAPESGEAGRAAAGAADRAPAGPAAEVAVWTTAPPASAPEGWNGLDRDERLTEMERAILFSILDLTALRTRMKEAVVEQDEAVDRLCDDLSVFAVGTRGRLRPLSYFLVGPTGSGKNHSMETLARLLQEAWGVELPCLVLEGPQYTYPSDVGELKGSTRGFIRSDEEGLLAEFHARARRAPLSILIVDEIEKAHPQLARFFLSLMDRGTTMDNRGRLLCFPSTVLAFTSNLGYSEPETRTDPIGYGSRRSPAARRRIAARDVRRGLPPEFLNRLTVLHFAPLTRASARRILDQEILRLAAAYQTIHGARLVVTPAAREALVAEGFSEEFGARHLLGVVDRVCNVEVSLRLGPGAAPLSETGRRLLGQIREARGGSRAIDEEDLRARVREVTRSRRGARRITVDRAGESYAHLVDTI